VASIKLVWGSVSSGYVQVLCAILSVSRVVGMQAISYLQLLVSSTWCSGIGMGGIGSVSVSLYSQASLISMVCDISSTGSVIVGSSSVSVASVIMLLAIVCMVASAVVVVGYLASSYSSQVILFASCSSGSS